MDNRKKILISIVVVVALVLLVLLSEATKTNKILECHYKINVYEETMKFEYNEGIIMKFDREEFAASTKITHDELVKRYEEKKSGLETDEYFVYDVEEVEGGIKAHTYIYMPKKSTVFNEFFKDMGISRISSLNTVKQTLEEKNYDCKIK